MTCGAESSQQAKGTERLHEAQVKLLNVSESRVGLQQMPEPSSYTSAAPPPTGHGNGALTATIARPVGTQADLPNTSTWELSNDESISRSRKGSTG